jgi:hypothetical protein
MEGLDFLGADPIVGAGGMPSFAQLRPYFLTEYPTSGEQLAALYDAYLRAYDGLINSIVSAWHPVNSGAVFMAMQGARKAVADLWAQGGVSSIEAVQVLAGLMGWFNANYVNSDGSVNWSGLNQPVNAAVIENAQAAAQTVVQAAKDAGQNIGDTLNKAASIAFWVPVLLIGGAVFVAGLLGWKLLGSDAGKAVAARYLPGRR